MFCGIKWAKKTDVHAFLSDAFALAVPGANPQKSGTISPTRPITFGVVCISLVGNPKLSASSGAESTSVIGLTSRLLLPTEDLTLPEQFDLGLVGVNVDIRANS
jgi:hypothetical protein